MCMTLLNWWERHQKKIMFVSLIIIFLCGILDMSEDALAEAVSLPKEVVVVKNEKEMIDNLLCGMQRHQSYFAFYYPGIEKKFMQYRKQSVSFQTFMDKLALKNGYITGILSGTCICICGFEKRYVTFQFHYLTTTQQDKRINRIARSMASKYRKKTPAFRAKVAHDYLIQKVQYDKDYYNPYYIFTRGRGICMSYALAYQRLMQEMKVPCVYVKGKNHAWNMVKIGSAWYNVDVTWDDAYGGYRYFLKSDKDFPGHRRPKSKTLSSLKKARKSYKLTKIR